MPADHHDVLIIGGGAAGLATAIFLRQQSPRSVTIVDGARSLGAKILVSGGGRCNVTNTSVTDRDFWGGRRAVIRQVLRALPVDATVAFFRSLGVALHEEAGGKLFPDSNRARDVLTALVREAHRLGVTIMTGARVLDVLARENQFAVATASGQISANTVVLATGGQSLPKSGSDGAGYAFATGLGHSLVDTTPALAPLVLDKGDAGFFAPTVSGVAHDAELTVWAGGRARERLAGALLWTHFGVSGPAALDASRHWARARLDREDPKLTVSFCPGLAFDDVDQRLIAAGKERPRASAQTIVAGILPASIAAAITDSLRFGAMPLAQLPRTDRRRLAHALTTWTLPVVDTRGYTYAEATAGGVALDEIDPSTMRSRVCAGLYLVGEILDVDGRLGGFNFQWAWASARVAARGIATAIR